jgi:hypothetical protein
MRPPPAATLPPHPTLRLGLGNGLAIVAIFAMLGPLIGLVVLAAGISLLAFAHGRPDFAWFGPLLLIYGWLIAHLAGVGWAALAGAAAAALAWWTGRRPRWIGIASGLFSFAVAMVAGAAHLPPLPATPDGEALAGLEYSYPLVVAFVHVIAALASWLVARRLIGGAPP